MELPDQIVNTAVAGSDSPRHFGTPPLPQETIPTLASVAVGISVSGNDIEIGQEPFVEWAPGSGQVRMLLTRNRSSQLLVFVLAIIPAVLAFLLSHLVFRLTRSEVDPTHHLLLNVAAAMLATLPLRQVLVPDYIRGLTQVDLLLAFGFGWTVSLALFGYAKFLWVKPIIPNNENQMNK